MGATDEPVNSASPLRALARDAAAEAERCLRQLVGSSNVRPVSAVTLDTYRSVFPAFGWRFEVEFEDGNRAMDLVLPGDFPFCAPRLALATVPPKGVVWPHVEGSGLLCLPDTDDAPLRDVREMVRRALSDATTLVQDCVAGRHDPKEFRDEFLSYWDRQQAPGALGFKSLLRMEGPSRPIRVWWGMAFALVAEADEPLKAWLDHRFGLASGGKERATDGGVLLWLPEPLLPTEYPSTSGDVLRLARDHAPDVADTLRELAEKLPRRIGVVLGCRTDDGPVAAGAILHKPGPVGGMSKRKKGGKRPLVNGFRDGKIPPSVVRGVYLGDGAKAERTGVDRVDSAWVHGRGRDAAHERLRAVRVGFVGCGSVGSGVAAHLAQAGIGRLLLIDPDVLSHSNTSRHVLGAEDKGRNKAERLATRLQRDLPHIQEVAFRPQTWQQVETEEPQTLRDCDLIVSTVGSWRVEKALNEVHVSDPTHPPVLYGWLEEQGAAGHALLVTGQEGCFHCGFDESGMAQQKVTSWPRGALVYREPGCSAQYQPYGAADMAPALALIARTALDCIVGSLDRSVRYTWVGDAAALAEAGGTWDSQWCSEVGDPGRGWCRIVQAWQPRSDCPACLGAPFR